MHDITVGGLRVAGGLLRFFSIGGAEGAHLPIVMLPPGLFVMTTGVGL